MFAIDGAMAMANRAIDLAEKSGNSAYYLDYTAIHCLLFLCQHKMLHDFGVPMFREDVYDCEEYPFIEKIGFVAATRGLSDIRSKFPCEEAVEPNELRLRVIDAALHTYGNLPTPEIVKVVKGNALYRKYRDATHIHPPIINKWDMETIDDPSIRIIRPELYQTPRL